MRLLDRYLLRELLLPLAYCIAGFLIIFISFDLVNELSMFQRSNLTVPDIAEYYARRAPEVMVTAFVVPVALLLALLYALTNHARHNELTAMRAAGVSLWRLCLPYFGVGVLCSAGVLAVNEMVVPDSSDAAEKILFRRHNNPTVARGTVWKFNIFFLNSLANRAWHISAYNINTYEMRNVQIDWKKRDGTQRQIRADRGWREGKVWVFTNVEDHFFTAVPNSLPTITKTNLLAIPELFETPRFIKSEIKISSIEGLRALKRTQLSTPQIAEYLRLHRTDLDPKKRDMLLTKMHNRMAMPWICFVVVLIAIPFGAPSGRRNVFVGVAASIFICFVFLVLNDLALTLGTGGRVPGWVAAWGPNCLFAITGIVLMTRVR